MTREAAKKKLVDLGIAEPTEQQVTDYLDSIFGEVQKEKDRNATLKEKADRADELQRQLDEIEQQNMSELEKEKKRADAAEALAAQRAAALTTAKVTSVFAAAGLTGDVYAGMIKALSGMDEEEAVNSATSFVNGISENKRTELEAAKSAWEAEKLKDTPNPGTGSGAEPPKGGEEESAAAKFAKQYSSEKNPKPGSTPAAF